MNESLKTRIASSVTVLESAISSIDPEGLRYRGYAIQDLANGATYEDVAWLLWTGELPVADERDQVLSDITAGTQLPGPVLTQMSNLPGDITAITRLQAMLPLLGIHQPELADRSALPGPRRAARLLGAAAVIAGSAARPDAEIDLNQLAGLARQGVARLYASLVCGDEVSAEYVRGVEQVLILYADHELNASTFAGRVAASTRADLVSSVLAALCTLRGPLHGGVDRYVRALLAAVEHEGAEGVIERYYRAGNPLPGFGHAVYRGIDPRAVLMRSIAEQLAPAAGQQRLYELTREVEEIAGFRRLPAANVDLYSTVVYRTLGIPDALTTATFALGRTAGWCAHILEQYENNRLIRPRASYIGPQPREYSLAT